MKTEKSLISVKIIDIVKKDKPGGEIVFEDFYKVVYLFGFLIYKRKYDYELTFTGNSNKPGFK